VGACVRARSLQSKQSKKQYHKQANHALIFSSLTTARFSSHPSDTFPLVDLHIQKKEESLLIYTHAMLLFSYKIRRNRVWVHQSTTQTNSTQVSHFPLTYFFCCLHESRGQPLSFCAITQQETNQSIIELLHSSEAKSSLPSTTHELMIMQLLQVLLLVAQALPFITKSIPSDCQSMKTDLKPTSFAYDHTTMNTPVLVWSRV